MEFFRKLYALLRHLGDDLYWQDMIQYVGVTNLYVLLFAIVFAETGLVVTPFLPGDSLLFALGAIGSREVGINLPLITGLLIVAAVVGDAVNYWIGYRLGPKVFNRESSRLLNKKHLLRAQEFYEKHGGKTIVIARFMPIVRTFAPVVAGVAEMGYRNFAVYNVMGGIAWVLSMTLAGYFLGRAVPNIEQNIHYVVAVVIFLSLLPPGIAWLRVKMKGPKPVEP
jgi:membrane-associated protein